MTSLTADDLREACQAALAVLTASRGDAGTAASSSLIHSLSTAQLVMVIGALGTIAGKLLDELEQDYGQQVADEWLQEFALNLAGADIDAIIREAGQ